MTEALRGHAFTAKLRQGEAVERELDEHFEGRYYINQPTPYEQRIGIDRIFVDIESGYEYAVEYKADWRATETGNVFIETVSGDSGGTHGWAYTSRADWLVYTLPQQKQYFLLRLEALRAKLPEWIAKYQIEDYSTHGVLVPLAEFQKLTYSDGCYGGLPCKRP